MGECVNGLGGSGHTLALPTAKSIMITCQHEWIEQCQLKYRYEPLPDGEHWEDAHYPEPECRNGTETVRLWSRDHAVHGFLQSEDLDQVCFHGYRRKTDRALIEANYPEYLELCDRWFIEAQKRAFQAKINKNPNCQSEAGAVSGKNNVLSGHLDRIRTPEHQRYAGSLGGKVSGPVTVKRLNEEKDDFGRSVMAVKASEKAHSKRDEFGRSVLGVKNAKRLHAEKDVNGKSVNSIKGITTTNSQIWESTVDGFRSSASGVARHNLANGWCPEYRIKVGVKPIYEG